MDIYQFFSSHGIKYECHHHPAVFTCEEADRILPSLPGAKTKNLFLRDKRGRRHFLITIGYEKIVDLKALALILGTSRLSLASPERLKKHLGVDPGAVSILGVVNDLVGEVEVVIDKIIWASKAFLCHPLVNTSTVVILKEDLSRFLDLTRHSARIIDLPAQG